MAAEMVRRVEAYGEGVVISAREALELELEVEGLDSDDLNETIEIAVDEAEIAIRSFAEQAASDPEISAAILSLLETDYEQQVAFLLASEWTFVEQSDSPAAAPGKKCTRQCMQVCSPICRKVCRQVCEKRGPKWVCKTVCEVVCSQVCKRICRQVCT